MTIPSRSMLALLALFAFGGCAGRQVRAPESPPSAAELMQRGRFFAEQGDDFAAEQYFDAARNAGYPEQIAVRELVRVCVQAGRLEQALRHAETYAERAPDDWLIRHVLASILFAKGEMVSAARELDFVLTEHPEHAESRYLFAIVQRDGIGDVALARQAFGRYLELAPEGTHAPEARAYLRRTPAPQAVVRKRTKS